ncbi:MAG: hypothetical protein DHS20C07_22280 [Methyloligella sp.]|nr:MAG: hypothetical protein DHS20C07_22280 [Methyloligella sp.]
MSNPHFDLKTISRSNGTWFSAVKAASYISGQRLYDANAKEYIDYTWRKDVAHSEILAPEGTPTSLLNRECLWNKVEECEKRKDSQLARSIIIGMPHEISHDERVDLLRGYVQDNFVSQGMIADIALHKPSTDQSADNRNHHAHILLTLRKADENGFYRTKTREWNSRDNAIKWRKLWADHQNQTFERKGLVLQVDERTLKPKHEMVYGNQQFPKEYQFELTPELKMGRPNSPDFAQNLLSNQSIIDGNLDVLSELHDKADKRLQKIDRMKARLKKQERERQRKQGRGIKTRDSEFNNLSQTIWQIKSASRIHKRLRFLAKKSDEHFQLMIYLHGFKMALVARKHDLRKLEKNLHYIEYLGAKIDKFFGRVGEKEQQKERDKAFNPNKKSELKPKKNKKLSVKNVQQENNKQRRRQRRKGPS